MTTKAAKIAKSAKHLVGSLVTNVGVLAHHSGNLEIDRVFGTELW
jgi:hypothetical protein